MPLNRDSQPDLAVHATPCSELVEVQAALAKIPSSHHDPVTPGLLALVIVVGVCCVLTACAYWKILPGEAIAATVGMLAGRLTSNIGGAQNGSKTAA